MFAKYNCGSGFVTVVTVNSLRNCVSCSTVTRDVADT